MPDIGFGALFVICFGIQMWLAIDYGVVKLLTFDESSCSSESWCDDESIYTKLDDHTGYRQIFYVFLIVSVLCVVLVFIWVVILLHLARSLIKLVCMITSLVLFVGSLFLVQKGIIYAQYILLPLSMIIILYYACKSKMPAQLQPLHVLSPHSAPFTLHPQTTTTRSSSRG